MIYVIFWSSPIKFNLLTHDQQMYSHKSVDYPDVNDVELLILIFILSRDLLTTMVFHTGLEPVTLRLKVGCSLSLAEPTELMELK